MYSCIEKPSKSYIFRKTNSVNFILTQINKKMSKNIGNSEIKSVDKFPLHQSHLIKTNDMLLIDQFASRGRNFCGNAHITSGGWYKETTESKLYFF